MGLCLALYLAAGCTAIPQEVQAAPTPTATAPPNYCTSIAAELPAPDAPAAWSPDGARYAVVDTGCAVVVEPGQERTLAEPIASGSRFWRWTADGRFAIFRFQNAKGNAMTYVADAETWEIERTPGCALIQGGSLLAWARCGDYPVALAPDAPRFLMENGQLVELPGLTGVRLDVPWNADHRFVLAAAWSPEGERLAFVTGNDPFLGGTLYLAQGDGTGIRESVSLDAYPSLQWAADGASVIVETEAGRTTVDAGTMQE